MIKGEGTVLTARAYLEQKTQSNLLGELRCSNGIGTPVLEVVDCPHNGRKNVVDKAIIGE